MTSPTKPVKRETAVVYRGRPLVVELHAGYLTIRLKGKRHRVTVDYRAIQDLGYKLIADEARRLKRDAKKNRRSGR